MRQIIFVLNTLALLIVSCTLSYATDKPSVFVSILPQKFFVEQIAGDLVDIQVMVKPGASPATYEPKVSQMKKLAVSDIYFAIGVPFERAWLARIAGVNSQMKIVRIDRGIDKLIMEKHLHQEEHGQEAQIHKGHGYSHEGGLDPHIWLSPHLVSKQAAVIAASLEALIPEKAAVFASNLVLFQEKIETLDAELHRILAGKEGLRFMVFHPSWGYFAKNYHLKQIPIESEGKGAKSSQLRELILYARSEGIKVIFAQPQFSRKSARLIAREIDGQVITVDPLAEDWLENMKIVAEKFREAVQ